VSPIKIKECFISVELDGEHRSKAKRRIEEAVE